MSSRISKQDIIKEIIRCVRDPIYFITTYGKIQHPVKGLIPFNLYPFQKDIINNGFIAHRKNIILKARQLGVTTTTAAYIAWLILFHRDKNVLIVATKQETSKNMIRIIRNIFKYIPKHMLDFGRIKVDNRHSIELENGSRVTAVTTSSNVGRSEAVSLLVVDEVAFIANFDEIWAGLSPTISTGGCIALFSSPNGTGNAFHRLYVGAQNNENGFNCRFGTYTNPRNSSESYADRFMWWVHPDHDEAWFAAESRDKTPREVSQEFLCFTGNTRIATDKGFKKIKDIIVGDNVLTHKGRFRKVVFVGNRLTDDICETKTYSNRITTKVTSEHPLLSECDGWREFKKLSEKSNVCAYPKNIKINTITQTIDLCDFINSENFQLLKTEDEKSIYINDRRFKTKVNRFIDIDYDLGLLVGLYLSEGHKGKNFISFSFNREKEMFSWVIKLCDILKNKFGIINPKIYHSSTKASILQINSKIMVKLINLFVHGDSCYNKRLSHFAYEKSNTLFHRGVINGLFLGDGCTKFEYTKSFTTTSENLAYDLKYLMMINGFGEFSFRKQNKNKEGLILGRNVSISDSYEIKLLRTRNKQCEVISDLRDSRGSRNCAYKNVFKENENFEITALLDKKDNVGRDTVYNIEVEEDHSFVTEHFVVHNCNFNASGDTFVFHEDISKMEKLVREPVRVLNTNRNVWIWEEPQPGATYLIPCDVSRGDAADFSAFHVLRIDTVPIRQVAEYKEKIKPDQLAYILMTVSKLYNNAMVAPENNSGWSGQTILKMQEAQFPFIYYSPKRKPKDKDSPMVDPYYAATRNDFLPGYSVNSANRNPMLAKMEQYIRMNDIELYSRRMVEELKTFIVTEHNRPEAQRGYNDDLIMALAGGLWVREEGRFHIYGTSDLTKAMLDAMSTSRTNTNQYSDFNFNVGNFYDRGRIAEHIENQHKLKMVNGDVIDISWLISKG